MKLTPVQEEFLNLLETTDQPQGKAKLVSAEGFCCLGLWTAHRGYKVEKFDSKFVGAMFNNSEVARLSKDLTSELGLYDHLGRNAPGSGVFGIAQLNDRGMSFKEIAALIRANPDYYFMPKKKSVPGFSCCQVE